MADTEKRVPGIDLLRGFCIVAVVLLHTRIRIHIQESAFGRFIGPAGDRILFWSGHYGVRVFFVISGFLIAGWSLKRWAELRNIRLRQFYAMRFARIAPCLLALLALLSVLDLAHVPQFTIVTHVTLGRALLAALTFHLNWLEIRTWYLPGAWDVLWSLSVEEVFYIFFPLLSRLVRKQILLAALFFGFIIVGPFARVSAPNEISADYGYFCCMDGIALGCLAAMLSARVKFSRRINTVLLTLGIFLASLIEFFRHTPFRFSFSKFGIDETVLEIGIALILIALQQRFERGLAQERAVVNSPSSSKLRTFLQVAAGWPSFVMRWFGRNSYEVYLTHMLVVLPVVMLFQCFHQSLNWAPLWFLATLVLAGLLGYSVSRFYSEPLNRALRERLMRAASPTAIAGSNPEVG